MATGAKLTPTLPMLDEVLDLAFDQTRLYAADSGGRLTVFDLETGHVEARIDAHKYVSLLLGDAFSDFLTQIGVFCCGAGRILRRLV
jgi:ferredoxin-NADP reductase